jgi:hypothetical protein
VCVLPNDFKHSDWVRSISYTKKYLLDGMETDEVDASLKSYSPYLINKQLSKEVVNIFVVNKLNINSHLDKKLQYDCLFNIIPKRNPNPAKKSKNKSISKKSNINPVHLNAVKEFYGYSNNKAKIALETLTAKQIHQIVYCVQNNKGGKK